MKRTLEERVTEGRSTFIERIEYFPGERRCAIRFIDNPEGEPHPRELIFTDILRFSDELSFPDDWEPDILENLIGFDEHPNEENREYRFVIVTCEREITITTLTEPELNIINT